MKRALIACEYSGIVREAFSRHGWDAWSCDLLPSDIPGQHIQGDVLDVLRNDWDLLIAFPPCTYLSSSGMHWTIRGLRDPQLTEDAIAFVKLLMSAPILKIAIENPVGVLSTRIRQPDQYIQPYQFGHDASKRTCLWLDGLRPLKPTSEVPPRIVNGRKRWTNQTDSGQNRLTPDPKRAHERSKTYSGIAEAMAAQWS